MASHAISVSQASRDNSGIETGTISVLMSGIFSSGSSQRVVSERYVNTYYVGIPSADGIQDEHASTTILVFLQRDYRSTGNYIHRYNFILQEVGVSTMKVYYSETGHAAHYYRDCPQLYGTDSDALQTTTEEHLDRYICADCKDRRSFATFES